MAIEKAEVAMTVTMQQQPPKDELLSAPLIAVICVICYLVAVAVIWLVRKCLVNKGMCQQCTVSCDCCLWCRDCCLGCGPCCQSCSVNGCLDAMQCPRHKYYCVDLMCCRCLCPDDSPCVNCCDDMASGSCECCGCQLNFTMAAQTARSPRQQIITQQPGYPMYPNPNQTLGGYIPPGAYMTTLPQTGFPPIQQPSFLGTYPPQGIAGLVPRINVPR